MRTGLLASTTLALLIGLVATAVALPRPEPDPENVQEGRPVAGATPYVIVTTRTLRPEFDRLAREHARSGLGAAVRTLESIRESYPNGRDDAERIRMFIQEMYATRGTRWALLGGDASLIPVRLATLPLSPPLGTVHLPTDQYYACLDGDWNADGDSEWGESASDAVDFVPELHVGRAPVRSKEETNRFVSRTIAALRQREPADNDVLLAAETMLDGQIDGAQSTEPLVPLFPSDPATHIDRLYENWTAWPGSSPESRVALIDALNQGYDLTAMVGAGAPGVFVAGLDHSATDHFTSEDADALINRDPTIFYFLSAYTCGFEAQPSIGASLVNARKGGAVAVLGPTDIEFIATGTVFMRLFFQAVYVQGMPTIGEALTQAVVASGAPSDFIRLTTQGMILLGDPALPMHPAPVPAALLAALESVGSASTHYAEAAADAGGWGLTMALRGSSSTPIRAAEEALSGVAASQGLAAAAASRLAFGAASPQPSRTHTVLELIIPASMDGLPLEVAAFDAAGRRVRTIERGTAKAGRRAVTWDLRSDAGARAADGVYFVTCRVAGQLVTGRVAVVR